MAAEHLAESNGGLVSRFTNRVSKIKAFVVLSLLLLPFQNCGKLETTSVDQLSEKSSSSGGSTLGEGDTQPADTTNPSTNPEPTPLPTPAPAPVPVPVPAPAPTPNPGPSALQIQAQNCNAVLGNPILNSGLPASLNIKSGWALNTNEANVAGHVAAPNSDGSLKMGIKDVAKYDSLGCIVTPTIRCTFLAVDSTKKPSVFENAVSPSGTTLTAKTVNLTKALTCEALMSAGSDSDKKSFVLKVRPRADRDGVRCLQGVFWIRLNVETDAYQTKRSSSDQYVKLNLTNTCLEQKNLQSQLSNMDSQDGFGSGAAANENYAVFTAPGDDGANNSKTDSGEAYLFEKQGGQWSFAKKLSPPTLAGDQLEAVAMNSQLIAVASARRSSNKGIVFIYKKNGASFDYLGSLEDGAAGSRFGYSLAMSENGHLAVGAPSANGFKGAVYLYNWNGAQFALSETITSPSPAVNEGFGSSLDADNSQLVIGAPQNTGFEGDAPGNAYSMPWNSNVNALARGTNTNGSRFGYRVAIYNGKIAVTAPWANTQAGMVAIYQSASDSKPVIFSSDKGFFGDSVAMNSRGVYAGGPTLRAGTGAVDFVSFQEISALTGTSIKAKVRYFSNDITPGENFGGRALIATESDLVTTSTNRNVGGSTTIFILP